MCMYIRAYLYILADISANFIFKDNKIPRSWRGKSNDFRSDTYSMLGGIMYHLKYIFFLSNVNNLLFSIFDRELF